MGYNKEKMIGGSKMKKDERMKDIVEFNTLDTDEKLSLSDEDYVDYEDYEDLEDFYDDDDVYDFSKPESSAGSWTSLVLGIISSLGWIIPVIGLPVSIVGTVFGAINMKSRKYKGVAIAGFVINLVFLCVSIAKGIVDIVVHAKKGK